MSSIACTGWAQVVQWATAVDYVYGTPNGAAEQVLGPPDARPFGQPSEKALKLNRKRGTGTVRVRFDHPTQVRQVVVVESYLPGSVQKVKLFDELGRSYPIWEQPSGVDLRPEQQRVLNLMVSETPYEVTKVEVTLSTFHLDDWAQIDAIGISTSDQPYTLDSYAETRRRSSARAPENKFVSQRISVGDGVNSRYAEINPVISPDGKTLYFARQGHPENTGGRRAGQDIWQSTRQADGSWSAARNVGPPLNNEMHNGVAAVSPDGKTLLLLNRYLPNGQVEPGVSLAHREGNGWSEPVAQHIEDYQNQSEYVNYFLADGGRVLLMAVERPGGRGDLDLYVSISAEENYWSKPRHMGDLNTPRADFAPFLAADGKTLYFASEGYDGYGGSDIYFTKRLDDTWRRWSKPKNLGGQINTPDWDAYYTVAAAGDQAYLVTTEGSTRGSRDIFKIALPNEVKPEPVVLVQGRVFDAKTHRPLAARISFTTTSGKPVQARAHPEDGTYTLVLEPGQKYEYVAEAPGYIGVDEEFSLVDVYEYAEMEQDIYLQPLQKGQTIRLKQIQFARSKHDLLPRSMPTLERLLRLMEENPTLEIELAGHTDNRGSFSANMQLSEDRVTEVKRYLTERGVKGRRISLQAYGPKQPIADNDDPEARRLNRRVEFTVTNLQPMLSATDDR
ncbi:MAG: OmpA family protein [Catalinimonas sp.]